jgi:hypothetical protein
MKNSNGFLIAVATALVLASCDIRPAVAQTAYPGGAFGPRVLGQSLAPQPNRFGGGVQLGAGGNFMYLGRPNGATSFVPWQQYYPVTPVMIDPGIAASAMAQQGIQPGAQIAVPSQVPNQLPAPAVQVGLPQQSPSPAPAPVVAPAGINATAFSAAPAPAWSVAIPRGQTAEASAKAARAEPFVRSPELSDRLTRIARTKGMLAGPAIDVYLSGNVAMMRGLVHRHADRVLLGNVMGLEPDVSRIDNRLAVAEYYHPSTTPAYGP